VRRLLVTPRWLALHVFTVVVVLVMVRLGWWQWGKGQATGSLRNHSYGLEWWAFAVLVVFGWAKFLRDERDGVTAPDRPDPHPEPARAPAVDEEDDPELAAYNRYLAQLAQNPRR